MTLAVSNPPTPQVIVPDTATAQLIDLWTHGKSKNTAALYRRVVHLLLATIDKPIQWLTLQDCQGFADTLEGKELSTSSRRTYISVHLGEEFAANSKERASCHHPLKLENYRRG